MTTEEQIDKLRATATRHAASGFEGCASLYTECADTISRLSKQLEEARMLISVSETVFHSNGLLASANACRDYLDSLSNRA